MIESGSLVPGVDPDRWRLPHGTAFRFELPALDLKPYLTDYYVQDSDGVVHAGAVNPALPSWPMIRFTLTPEPINVRLGNRSYTPLPPASLFGTTSRVMEFTSHGGITVGIGIRPLGWSRLFTAGADEIRDRIVPLATLMPPAAVDAVMAQLRVADLTTDVPAILDAFVRSRLLAPDRDEHRIAALSRLIADEDVHDVATIMARMDIKTATLRRLSTKFFGFSPKLLLVRARFVRSLVRMMLDDGDADYSRIAPTYFDASHFLRDARRFLDTTPHRFLKLDHAYTTANIRARADVMHHAALARARRTPLAK